MSLSELVKILQDFEIFIVIVLLAYVVYRVGKLVEVLSSKIKTERD